MIPYWVNNVDLPPIRKGHNTRVGTEYRLVNEDGECLGFAQGREHYWIALDFRMERIGDTFDTLAGVRQALVNHYGRADRA